MQGGKCEMSLPRLILSRLGNKIIKNGPRIIDLDIIFYNKIILTNHLITIPHPKAHIIDFVLFPIQEMNPFYRHPSEKKTIKEFL